MRAYGATTMGVLANVGGGGNRAILGFIAYGFAEMLLRLDRIEEYLLFCYGHRYHDHSPGSWTAGEVAGLGPGKPTFCIPAQQTIPCVVRWMLAIEDHDEDRLYLAKGVPRAWVASGKPIRIDQAPTRWGRVNLRLAEPAAIEERGGDGGTGARGRSEGVACEAAHAAGERGEDGDRERQAGDHRRRAQRYGDRSDRERASILKWLDCTIVKRLTKMR